MQRVLLSLLVVLGLSLGVAQAKSLQKGWTAPTGDTPDLARGETL